MGRFPPPQTKFKTEIRAAIMVTHFAMLRGTLVSKMPRLVLWPVSNSACLTMRLRTTPPVRKILLDRGSLSVSTAPCTPAHSTMKGYKIVDVGHSASPDALGYPILFGRSYCIHQFSWIGGWSRPERLPGWISCIRFCYGPAYSCIRQLHRPRRHYSKRR